MLRENALGRVAPTSSLPAQSGEAGEAGHTAQGHYEVLTAAYPERSCFIFSKASRVRKACVLISHNKLFENFIFLVIICNCVTLALSSSREGFDGTPLGRVLSDIDWVFIAIFTLEMVLKIISMGFVLKKGTYLRDGWNVLDFVVVVVSYVGLVGNSNLSGLRTIRALRPLRAVRRIQGMRVLVSTMIGSLPMLLDVFMLCAFTFFMFGIIAVQLFAGVLRNRCGSPDFSGAYNVTTLSGGGGGGGGGVGDSGSGSGRGGSGGGGPLLPVLLANVSYVVSEEQAEDMCSGPLSSEVVWYPSGGGSPPTADPGKHYAGRACDDGMYCTWYGNPYGGLVSYDNMLWSWLTIFQHITLSGWTDVMYMVMDAVNYWVWIFYVGLIIFGAFFMINLALAVLSVNFSADQRKEEEAEQMKMKQRGLAAGPAPGEVAGGAGEEEGGGGGGGGSLGGGVLPVGHITNVMAHLKARKKRREEDDEDPSAATGSPPPPGLGPLRRAAWRVALSRSLELTTAALILVNTAVMCVNWYGMPYKVEAATNYINYGLTGYFVLELLVRITALGFRRFFRSGMNIFDAFVVAISLVEMIVDLLPSVAGLGPLSVLRAFSLLRIFRLARNWRQFNAIIRGMFKSVQASISLVGLMLLFLFIASLIGGQLFGYKFMFCDYVEGASAVCPPGQEVWGECPNYFHCYLPCGADQYGSWIDAPGSFYNDLAYCDRFCASADAAAATTTNASSVVVAAAAAAGCEYLAMVGKSQVPRAHFDNVFWGIYTVFQLLTGEDWNSVMYDGMRTVSPWASLYFVGVILIGNYLVFNLFIAILLDNFSCKMDEGEEGKESGEDKEGKDDTGTGTQPPAAAAGATGGSTAADAQAGVPDGTTASPSAAEPQGSGGDDDDAATTPRRRDGEAAEPVPGQWRSSGDLGREDRAVGGDAAGAAAAAPPPPAVAAAGPVGPVGGRPLAEGLEASKQDGAGRIDLQAWASLAAPAPPPPPPPPRAAMAGNTAAPAVAMQLSREKESDPVSADLAAASKLRWDNAADPTDPNGGGGAAAAAAAGGGGPSPQAAAAAAALELLAREASTASFTWRQQRSRDVSVSRIPRAASSKSVLAHLKSLGGSMSSQRPRDGAAAGTTKAAAAAAVAAWEAEEPQGRSLLLLAPTNPLRRAAASLVRNTYFDACILLLIAASCVCLVLDSPDLDPASRLALALRYLDYTFTAAFTLEAILKVLALGLVFTGRRAYLRCPWNVLDLAIVLLGWALIVVESVGVGAGNVKVLRVLRALRALRPLRAAKRFPGLRLVVTALFAVLPAMLNVALVCVFFYLIFAILAVNLFKGKLYNCIDADSGERIDPFYVLPSGEKLTRSWCEAGSRTINESAYYSALNVSMPEYEMETQWVNPQNNFDHVGAAMLTLFQAATLSMWVDITFSAVDATGVDRQPLENHSPAIILLFILFIVVCSFFVLNLFVGVTLDKFSELHDAEREMAASVRLSPSQQAWVDVQQLLLRTQVAFRAPRPARPALRRVLYDCVTHPLFDWAMMAVIIANVVFMACVHVDMSPSWQDLMSNSNLVFTCIFVAEAALKLTAFGPRHYFRDGWNCFDFFVVVVSVASVVLDFSNTRNVSFMPVLRVLRVARVVRLVRNANGMQKLLRTLVNSLPALANVGGVMLLFFFIFAVIGVNLFAGIKQGENLTRHANFDNFPNAMLLLFRMITGEGWNGVMLDCMSTGDCVLVLYDINVTNSASTPSFPPSVPSSPPPLQPSTPPTLNATVVAVATAAATAARLLSSSAGMSLPPTPTYPFSAAIPAAPPGPSTPFAALDSQFTSTTPEALAAAAVITLTGGTYLDPSDPLLSSLPANATDNQCPLSAVAAVLYFPIFVILCTFILLQLVIAVLLENLMEAESDAELPIPKHAVDSFVEAWAAADGGASSGLLHAAALVGVVCATAPPLGTAGRFNCRVEAQEKLFRTDIPLYPGSKVSFIEVLYSLSGAVCGTALPPEVHDRLVEQFRKRLPPEEPWTSHTAAHYQAAGSVAAAIRGFMLRHTYGDQLFGKDQDQNHDHAAAKAAAAAVTAAATAAAKAGSARPARAAPSLRSRQPRPVMVGGELLGDNKKEELTTSSASTLRPLLLSKLPPIAPLRSPRRDAGAGTGAAGAPGAGVGAGPGPGVGLGPPSARTLHGSGPPPIPPWGGAEGGGDLAWGAYPRSPSMRAGRLPPLSSRGPGPGPSRLAISTGSAAAAAAAGEEGDKVGDEAPTVAPSPEPLSPAAPVPMPAPMPPPRLGGGGSAAAASPPRLLVGDRLPSRRNVVLLPSIAGYSRKGGGGGDGGGGGGP
ncbi:Caveolin-2 [Pleodorina starrii]|nr:Caveolin-2 [Pleodorina starrii]